MRITRTIMLVLLLRGTTLGAGCGRADVGEQCNNHDGACDVAPECKDGLYCDFESATCQTCDEAHCGAEAPTYTPTPTTPPSPGCSTIVDAAACGRDDEELLYCDPAGGGPSFASDCRELGSSSTYCCPFSPACDASTDAAEDAAEAAVDDAGDE